MKKISTEGNCLQCNIKTNIILENKKFVCQKCLDNLGQQQRYMYKVLKDYLKDEDFKLYLNKIIAILEMMQENDCIKTIHCIKTLKSFVMTYDLENNSFDDKILQKLLEMIDNMK